MITTAYKPMHKRCSLSSDILCCISACYIKMFLRAIKFVFMPSHGCAAVTGRGSWRSNGTTRRQTTHGQSSRGLINSQSSQLAEMFDLKFGVYNYNSSKGISVV